MDSILNQTLHNIEIICVNDGSTDESLAILEEYSAKDERIRIINQKNSGLSVARNVGMKNANAEEYIGFVDSDDWIEPDTYELAYKAIKENMADMVCWYAQIEFEYNSQVNKNDIQRVKEYHKIKNTGFHLVSDSIFNFCTVTTWNKLYRKSLIEKYNISFPVGLIHEDVEFFYKYALICKNIYFIDKYLTHYLQRVDSLVWKQIINKNKLIVDRIKIMIRLYNYFVENDLLSKYKKTIADALIWYCFVEECKLNSKENQLKIYKYASTVVKEMDLTQLDDSNNILYNLKREKYWPIFLFFLAEDIKKKLRKRLIYRLLRKIYHKYFHNTIQIKK